jgi:3-hydroxyacyl-[acyl-carrier-protein] dehydratase
MRFILVDEIIELVAGKHIRATKTIPSDDDVFKDHFPGFPVVPGVLLVEMMAQTAGKCLDAEDVGRGKAMLIRIDRASFRRWIRPDERIDIMADIKASTRSAGSANARLSVGDQEAADATLYFSFLPPGRLAAGYVDDVLARYLHRHPPTAPDGSL